MFPEIPQIRTLLLAYLLLIASCLSCAIPASGQTTIPGWEGGLQLAGRDIGYSSVNAAEVDGNLANGLEVIAGGADGVIYVFRADGSPLWSHALPNSGCTKTSNTNKLMSAPAVGALFGDGVPYVVVGYGGIGGAACGGGVVAINGVTGERRWHFDTVSFAKRQGYGSNLFAVVSSPALADVNGDGTLEVGFGSHDRNIYFLNSRGKALWYYNAADTVWSSPAFADLDGDGFLEMIIGTDISGNKALRPPTKDGGNLYAFRTKFLRSFRRTARSFRRSRKVPRYYFRDSRAFLWQTVFDQTIFSSPSVGDLIPENPGLEVAIGSGFYFPAGSNDKRGKEITIVSGTDGTKLRTLATNGCLASTPAIGDLNGDGSLEVVATVNGHPYGSGLSTLVAWNPATSTQLWSVVPRTRGGNNSRTGDWMSPVIADVDGNGSVEVVSANGSDVHIYNGADGTALTCQTNGCLPGEIRLNSGDTINSTPAVVDINLDGVKEILVGSGGVYGWTDLASAIVTPIGPEAPFFAPWGLYRGNSAHTALFGE